jgi:hypothetical protein
MREDRCGSAPDRGIKAMSRMSPPQLGTHERKSLGNPRDELRSRDPRSVVGARTGIGGTRTPALSQFRPAAFVTLPGPWPPGRGVAWPRGRPAGLMEKDCNHEASGAGRDPGRKDGCRGGQGQRATGNRRKRNPAAAIPGDALEAGLSPSRPRFVSPGRSCLRSATWAALAAATCGWLTRNSPRSCSGSPIRRELEPRYGGSPGVRSRRTRPPMCAGSRARRGSAA